MDWNQTERDIDRIVKNMDALIAEKRRPSTSKAAAILAGGNFSADDAPVKAYTGEPFLRALVEARRGDPEANAHLKAILGTSNATGLSVVPNAFVAGIAEFAGGENVYRKLLNFVTIQNTNSVDIPYDLDEIEASLLQGAYGSNKDVRDHHYGESSAVLYQIATIVDIGNQLLRQSGGVAEAHARRRLGKYLAKAEARYVTSGTGSSQPLGIFQAFTNTFVSAYTTALSSEPKVATIGRAIGALAGRGQPATAIVTSPAEYWDLVTETLGSSDEGGFAVMPGGTAASPQLSLWGIPIYRDIHWPAAQSGVALVGNFAEVEYYVDGEMRIDVSSEANLRFDQNITGFRMEVMEGFNATPWYLTGHFQRVTGL